MSKESPPEESVLFQTAHFRDYLLVMDQITQTIHYSVNLKWCAAVCT